MEYFNKTIEDLLESYRPAIGADYDKYKNHVYRVFLNCILIDHERGNVEKYAIAAVFHDIGIWTDRTIDYLYPSIDQMEFFLENNGKREWNNEITLMIYWHHKTGRYDGKCQQTVETFRKADWIDVSLGLITFGAEKHQIRQTRKMLPNLGFHVFLAKKIFRNFFMHPLNPLPMFK
ncbi:HD domain-containing protein [Dyadobacter psychrotolerans]|uniref:Phosphohydrolase n=1 Tax=Dyadobacter psychrotolerans TaxID=2541721 RepID=A0A4R5DAU6_9BACT|nr:HD domain-containing protein [Dyadobacter psychrotolerans]TDE10739.1 phosphohydrolase [Dyadobacter psychrotolerans]